MASPHVAAVRAGCILIMIRRVDLWPSMPVLTRDRLTACGAAIDLRPSYLSFALWRLGGVAQQVTKPPRRPPSAPTHANIHTHRHTQTHTQTHTPAGVSQLRSRIVSYAATLAFAENRIIIVEPIRCRTIVSVVPAWSARRMLHDRRLGLASAIDRQPLG